MDRADEIIAEFSRRVRELRESSGISQEAFALEAKIDRSYYGRVERGQANLTLRQIIAIAAALEVPVDKLFRAPRKKPSKKN